MATSFHHNVFACNAHAPILACEFLQTFDRVIPAVDAVCNKYESYILFLSPTSGQELAGKGNKILTLVNEIMWH
eukprot:scaffold1169_cov120-Cylindrotheca_fusiformis.AAC.8